MRSCWARRPATRPAPLVASGAAYAGAKATDLNERAAARAGELGGKATGKVAELKGEKPKKKGSKLKKLVLVGGLAAAVGVVAKKLQGGSESQNWQSSYVPTPPASGTGAAAATTSTGAGAAPTPAAPMAGASDDTGGSSPDEALADEAETVHPVTTPDEPAEVVDIEDDKKDS